MLIRQSSMVDDFESMSAVGLSAGFVFTGDAVPSRCVSSGLWPRLHGQNIWSVTSGWLATQLLSRAVAAKPTGTAPTPGRFEKGRTQSSNASPEAQPTEKGPFAVDDISLEELVREHADAVYRVALSVTRDPMLAEDASQDSLIKAWQALPKFRGEAPLRNWILRITHNTAVSILRKRRDELRDPEHLPERVAYGAIETEVQHRLALERFEAALEDLHPTSRAIIVLREVEGLAYDEICDVLELSMPTVKTRLLRGRRQLAKALDGWQP